MPIVMRRGNRLFDTGKPVLSAVAHSEVDHPGAVLMSTDRTLRSPLSMSILPGVIEAYFTILWGPILGSINGVAIL